MSKKNKSGRKNKYDTHVKPRLMNIEHWCRDGLTEEEICKRLGIAVSTLQNYKNQYLELLEALKRGKEQADYEVEDALFKRALGYEYEEVTREPLYNPVSGEPILNDDGTPKIIITKVVRKQVSPDTTAQIFWLKNRQPEKWRDKQDIEHSGNMNVNNPYADLTTEELRKLIEK